jgi:dihydroorotate dehydrogenase (NAD+) catalytic subunit
VPVFAKLSPDVTDITAIARSCVDAGADGLSVINTLLGMVIDTDLLRPQLAGVTGGLSGPAVRPVAVRALWQVTAAMREGRLRTAPLIGVGGVRTGRDALELVAAGASAVQVGTATFNDPSAPRRVVDELEAEVERHGFHRFADVVGIAHERTVRP